MRAQTLHDAIDFYYGLGTLINFYSHTLSTGLGDAGPLVADYITYSLNTNVHPRIWSANAASVYQWWLARSNAQISVSCVTNGFQTQATFSIQGASDPRVPVGEAIQIHDALSARGVDAPLILFADEGHGAQKRENVVTQLGEIVAFFEKHLKN